MNSVEQAEHRNKGTYNTEQIEDIVNRNVVSLYYRIFKVESPARRLMQHLLSRFICYGKTVLGTLLDRVVSL